MEIFRQHQFKGGVGGGKVLHDLEQCFILVLSFSAHTDIQNTCSCTVYLGRWDAVYMYVHINV